MSTGNEYNQVVGSDYRGTGCRRAITTRVITEVQGADGQ